MTQWLRRVRGALLMGLTWAVLWAPVGLLIGMIVDPDGSMDEPWILVGTLPGFLGGVAFAAVLGVVGRRRRFDELSLPRFAAWGAGAGLLVGGIWVLLAVASDPPKWLLYGVVLGSLTLLSALSAAGSLALAQRAQRRELLDGGASLDDVGLTEGEVRELLGGPDVRLPRRPVTGPSRGPAPTPTPRAARPRSARP